MGPQGQQPPHLNVAGAAAGARATTSSTLDGGRAAEGAINGDRAGRDWGSGGGWHDATPEEFPDWLEVSFAGPRVVGEVSVFAVQDNFLWPAEPDEQLAFTRYGVTEFDVQYWDGTGWVTAAGVTGNDRVWRRVRFAEVMTTKLRVVVRGALAGYSRIAEVEAYGAATAGRVRWLVTDQLGTPRMVVDETGSLAGVTRHDYLPFGEELFAGVGGRTTNQGYSGNDNIRQQWHTLERDDETGLDYAQARYYASTQGRFTSVDPLMASGRTSDPQTWNRYSYGYNNPLRFTDPNGMLAGDFYNQDGKRLGTDGIDDGKIYVVPDKEQAKQIEQANKKGGTTQVGTVSSAVELPSLTVRTAIGAAVERSNSPSGNDTKGGFHEEGLMGGPAVAGGQETIVNAAPGAYSDPRVDTKATIDVTNPANPAQAGILADITVMAHVHPSGVLSSTSGPSSGGGKRFSAVQSPRQEPTSTNRLQP